MTSALHRRARLPTSREDDEDWYSLQRFQSQKSILPFLVRAVVAMAIVLVQQHYIPIISYGRPSGGKNGWLHIPHQSDNPNLRQARKAQAVPVASSKYHVVFSTSCRPYEELQSYVFFYHAKKSGQLGNVTRVASGCSNVSQGAVADLFKQRIQPMSDRFHLHFTPNFQTQENRTNPKYNIPFGLQHWMQKTLGYRDGSHSALHNDVLIFLSPVQLLLRPFTDDFAHSTEEWYFENKFLDRFNDSKVRNGSLFAQANELWQSWTGPFPDLSAVTQESGSAANSLSLSDMRQRHSYSPPYIATVGDMYRIVEKWTEFIPRVDALLPNISAEMVAYSIAAAHLELPHRIARSFVLSDVDNNETEAWSMVDEIPTHDVCRLDTQEDVPHMVRYSQTYNLGKYVFHEKLLPLDFLSCTESLLEEPPEGVAEIKYFVKPGEYARRLMPRYLRNRNAFVLCTIIPKLNEALVYFKQRHCNLDEANFNKRIIFTKV